MISKRSFASDNYAGAHPAILKAIEACNSGHAQAYGQDPYTARAVEVFRQNFGESASAFFVFNGTAANVLGLKSVTQSYHAILCTDSAHIHLDECGAPENFTGCKLLPLPAVNGKLTPEAFKSCLSDLGNTHRVQPRVLSISQSTELGTVYSVSETKALGLAAHQHGLLLHMDGARLANAAAFLGASLKELTAEAGVDVLSFGGTKNGLLLGEAVVFFDPELAKNFEFVRKQGMQLGSKMRFVAAQFEALLSQDLWLKNAAHANTMAQALAKGLEGLSEVKLEYPVESNAVFARLSRKAIGELQREFQFYVWDEPRGVVRWMTAFDTTLEEVEFFVKRVRQVCSR